MNNRIALIVLSLLLTPYADAARSSRSAPKGQKVKTVGDLLKKIRNTESRQKSVIPTESYQKKVQTVNLKSVKPPRSRSFFSSGDKDEDALERILDDEIDQLFKLAQKYKTSENRGEIWLRLAERYVEKAQLIEFRVQRKFDLDLEKWEKSGRKGRRPNLNLNASRDYNKKAIKLYEAFLESFPKDNKADQALFFLGYNHFEIGDAKKGESFYTDLTKKYPRSPYVNESHFALGEYYFENSKWADAKKHYLKVARNRRARLYTFALYKLAWCEYRLGRAATALALYEKVIKDAGIGQDEEVAGTQKVNKVRLAREAENEIVPIFAEIKDYRTAESYFENLVGSKRVNDILERLAYIYSYAGKRAAARDLFTKLISANPTNVKAFDYQYQIVSNYIDGGDDKVFKGELFEWIEKYSPDSRWAKANSSNKEAVENAQAVREKTLRTYVLKSHKIAQDSRTKSARVRADEGYRLYLATFTDSKNVSDMHFYYGELLFDLEKYEEAAVHYLWVADNDPKSQFAERAILNTLLALEKRLPPEDELVAKSGKGLDKVPYSKAELRFVKAAERYLQSFGDKSSRAPDVKFKVARLQYAHNELDEALSSFWKIVEQYPTSEYATYSANLILDIYNLKGDYDGLVKAGDKLLKYPKLIEKGTAADIQNVVERAEFKKAQDLEGAKDYAGSAKEYQAFALKNPKSDLASTAFFNAGINFERGGAVLLAIANYERVLKLNDKNAKTAQPRAKRLVARLYEKTGQMERAAIEFEEYGKAYPKDQYADESFLNAAIIFAGLKRYDRAVADYQLYYRNSRSRERVNALYREAEISEWRGRTKAAFAQYERFIKDNPADANLVMLAHVKMLRLAQKLNWRTKSDEWATKTISVQKALSRRGQNIGKSEAAEALFHLVSRKFAEYVAIKIPVAESQQLAAIKRKTSSLAALTKDLEEVVKYDDADYVIAAVTMTGQANEDFVRMVQQAPIPKGMTADQQKKYRDELEKQLAEAPKAAAIKSYGLATSRSKDLKTYNEWVVKAYEGLQRLEPSKAVTLEESVLFSAEVDDMAIGENKKYADLMTVLNAKDEAGVIREGSKILAEEPDNIKVLNAMAALYLETGRPQMADIYLNKIASLKKDEASLYNNMAVSALRKDEQSEAVELFKKAISESSGNAASNANLGSIQLRYYDFEGAAEHLQVAAKSYSGNAEIQNNYAISMKKTGDKSKAESAYEKATTLRTNDAAIQMNYARFLAEDMKDKARAIKVLNKVKFIGGNSKATREADELLRRIQ